MLAVENQLQIISTHTFANVVLDINTKQQMLVATHFFNENDVLTNFEAAEILAEPNYLTVQIGTDRHITLLPSFLQYINHSCEPNVFFDTTAMQLICLKPIAAGDELCFFYPSSEWAMAQAFVCHCDTASCLELISGAANLSKEVINRYRVTDFIGGMLDGSLSLKG